MTIVLHEKTSGNITGHIVQENPFRVYTTKIYNNGSLVYKNYFQTFESAKKALNRNMKKYE